MLLRQAIPEIYDLSVLAACALRSLYWAIEYGYGKGKEMTCKYRVVRYADYEKYHACLKLNDDCIGELDCFDAEYEDGSLDNPNKIIALRVHSLVCCEDKDCDTVKKILAWLNEVNSICWYPERLARKWGERRLETIKEIDKLEGVLADYQWQRKG